MSCTTNTNLVTSGLVLNYDASNLKSHVGIGEDKIGSIYPSWSAWGGLTGSSVAYTSKYGQGVHLNTIVGGGVEWCGNTASYISCIGSAQYIITARIKWNGTIPHPNIFYVRQRAAGGAQTSESGKFSTANTKLLSDGFYYAWAYFTTDATAIDFYVHSYEYNGGMDIWLENMKCRRAGLADLSGNGNHGTFYNNLDYSSLNCGSIVFDGVSDYIECGNSTSLHQTNSITMSAWINPTSTTSLGNIMSKNSNSGYRFRIDSTANAVWWYVSGNALQGGQCPNGSWSHCLVSGNSSGLKIYVNGNLVASNAVAFTPTTASAGNLLIGTVGGSEYFNGKISQALVYNRELSASEVRQNFEATKSKFL